MEINRIRPDEHNFTQRLANIANPPKSLCFMGKLPTSGAPVVAIVGSRKPSAYGREVTEQLAGDLATAGCIIVSGLALGIDGIAQKAALEAGGTVIGVIPNELPDISPQTNYKLAMSTIKNGGAILSEWQKGDGKVVNRWSFLERNRLVSGLADAVIITEAAERSGTLNTAAHALSQGRRRLCCTGQHHQSAVCRLQRAAQTRRLSRHRSQRCPAHNCTGAVEKIRPKPITARQFAGRNDHHQPDSQRRPQRRPITATIRTVSVKLFNGVNYAGNQRRNQAAWGK